MQDFSPDNEASNAKNLLSQRKITVRLDNVLNRVILIFAVLTILTVIATIFLYQRKVGSALILLAMVLTMILTKLLMRDGRLRLAGICIISGTWLVLSVFLVFGGGMTNINVIYFVSMTVWAGLLLGTQAMLWVAGASTAMGLGLALMAMFGALPDRYFLHTPLSDWLQMVFALILTAGTLNLALRNQDQALALANQQLSERLETEKALRESENKYRLITEKMSDIVWMADMNLKTIYVTPSVQTVLGFTQEERMAQTVEQQFTPESLSVGMAAMAREMAREQTGEASPERTAKLVLEYYHKDGSTRWMETVMTGLRNDQGTLIGLHGVSRDVTDHKKAQKALHESEEKFRSAVEKSLIGIAIIDDTYHYAYVNEEFCHMAGYERHELLGKHFAFLLAEESKSFVIESNRRRMTGQDAPAEYEFAFIRKTGQKRIGELRSAVYRNSSGKMNVIVQIIDITDRKKAEQALRTGEKRYRTIFENTATANLIVADDATILMANNNFVSMCGYSQMELEGKKSWVSFIHSDDLEKMATYHALRRINASAVPTSYEFRFINRRGEIRNLFLTVALIAGTTDSIVSMIDLTGRKQLETQLLQAQKMESVGRLAGGVAHDFNNMLSVIIGNAELAISKLPPADPVRRPLLEILSAGIKSSDLTRQLLAFARKQVAAPKVLDLNDTVSGMLKMLRRLIGEDIDLAWHPGANLWTVKIDPSQVDQLLANLSINARDAIEKAGKVSIETSNVVCDDTYCAGRPDGVPGEYVVLALSDDGCGMDKETLDNIFEPFFTTKAEGRGTGLGLATVYGIVKQNGGFINVYSEPGLGTTFRIYLPRYVEESSESVDDQPAKEIPRGSETILIVEDEETVLNLSRAMLEMLGYRVLTASKADQALRLAAEYGERIDMLLTDIVMPDMNGKQLCERITSIKPDLKCLYMSGYTADVIARQGILEEGIQFISKPFSLKDLAVKIRETLE